MLTVNGLIQLLSNLDPDLPVVRYHYEGGFNDVAKVREVELVTDYYDPEEWWYGLYEDLEYVKTFEQEAPDPSRVFKAVFIH